MEEFKHIRVSDLEKIDAIGKDVADIKNNLLVHLTESNAVRDCVQKLDHDLNGNGKEGLKEEFRKFKWITYGVIMAVSAIWTVATFIVPLLHRVN